MKKFAFFIKKETNQILTGNNSCIRLDARRGMNESIKESHIIQVMINKYSNEKSTMYARILFANSAMDALIIIFLGLDNPKGIRLNNFLESLQTPDGVI